jgi:hypothetical protein
MCSLNRISGSIDLIALEDEWYQDATPENLGSSLQTGIRWIHQETGSEWVLAGREIFVLAAGTTHRGFVSCARLMLGHEHAVLCTLPKLAAVECALQKAGCAKWNKFGEEDGAPPGWILVSDTDSIGRIRGFVPTNPVPLEESSEILNVLRPLPQIDISLEGGVPLGHSSWLAGYPPSIRILGDVQHAHKVLIDGKEATIEGDGVCRVSGLGTLSSIPPGRKTGGESCRRASRSDRRDRPSECSAERARRLSSNVCLQRGTLQ